MKAHSLPYKTELPGWQDYLELCKPKVVALMLLTSVIGMLLATYTVPGWQVLVLGNLGIGLMAGSAAAINHVVDRLGPEIDLLRRGKSMHSMPCCLLRCWGWRVWPY